MAIPEPINYKDYKKKMRPQTPQPAGQSGALAKTGGFINSGSILRGANHPGGLAWEVAYPGSKSKPGSASGLGAGIGAEPQPQTELPKADNQKMQRPQIQEMRIPQPRTQLPEFDVSQRPEPAKPQFRTYQTTELGQRARDLQADYALGQDPMVDAEEKRVKRMNLLRTEQARRMAHDRAVREGFPPGSAQYEQMMRSAVSDAENQNIAAVNQLNTFMRQRRSDQQRELEGIAAGEYERGREFEREEFDRFEDVVKFLPSDKAQQAAMAGMLGGQDISTVFRGMYNQDGTIKDEYKDLNKAEMIKTGVSQAVEQMQTNPETGQAWKGNEKEQYIDRFYQDNFQNILYPAQVQSERREQQEQIESRVDDYIETGNYENMQQADWDLLFQDPNKIQKAKSEGHIKTVTGKIDSWSTDKKFSNANNARGRWKENNPDFVEGNIVENDGIYYKVTIPAEHSKAEGSNTYRIRTKGIALNGPQKGKVLTVAASARYKIK